MKTKDPLKTHLLLKHQSSEDYKVSNPLNKLKSCDKFLIRQIQLFEVIFFLTLHLKVILELNEAGFNDFTGASS